MHEIHEVRVLMMVLGDRFQEIEMQMFHTRFPSSEEIVACDEKSVAFTVWLQVQRLKYPPF